MEPGRYVSPLFPVYAISNKCRPDIPLAETAITPQIFASHLCADFRLPREPFEREIVNAVQKQLTEAQLGASYSDHLADRLTTAREESRRWLEGRATKRRRTKRSEVEVNASGSEGEKIGAEATEGSDDGEDGAAEAADLLSLKDFSNPSDELRLVIKVRSAFRKLWARRTRAVEAHASDPLQLDITLDSIQLVDQFEWDISDPNNSPEAFAEAFAAELGLSGEFV